MEHWIDTNRLKLLKIIDVRNIPGYDKLPKWINIPENNISLTIEPMDELIFIDGDSWFATDRRICDEIAMSIECTDYDFFSFVDLPTDKVGFPINKIIDFLER